MSQNTIIAFSPKEITFKTLTYYTLFTKMFLRWWWWLQPFKSHLCSTIRCFKGFILRWKWARDSRSLPSAIHNLTVLAKAPVEIHAESPAIKRGERFPCVHSFDFWFGSFTMGAVTWIAYRPILLSFLGFSLLAHQFPNTQYRWFLKGGIRQNAR